MGTRVRRAKVGGRMAGTRRASKRGPVLLESGDAGGEGWKEEVLRPSTETSGPGSAAFWRAVWTAIFVVVAGALNSLLADPEFVPRFLAGDYSTEFVRFVIVTAVVGALAAVKRYYDIKIPGP